MEADEKFQQLKELEKVLQQELEPGKPVPNAVDESPSTPKVENANLLTEPAAGFATSDDFDENEGGGNEISLENLDQLLGESDPTFVAQMAELQQSVKDEDVSLGSQKDVLAEVASEFESLVSKPGALTAEKLTEAAAPQVLKAAQPRILTLPRNLRNREARLAWLRYVQDFLRAARQEAGELAQTGKGVLSRMGRRQWLTILAFCVSILVMGFAYRAVRPILELWKNGDLFGNYDQVADHIYNLEAHSKWRTFRDPLEDFNFIVQYDRMIVNLQRSVNSTLNPMATFVIYLEGTSRETAVEIKDRQMEIKDICQRVAEGLNYDEFVSAEGKRRFKNLVRKNVNEILNQGRLRAIYFDTIIIKP